MTISTMYAGLSGSCQLVSQPYAGNGGSWHACRFVYVGQGGGWQQIFKQEDALALADTQDASNDANESFPGTLTITASALVTASGGSGSYTAYSWSKLS